MKNRNSWLVILVICSISLGLINAMQINTIINFSDKEYIQKGFDDNNESINQENIPKVSTGANYRNLESIFNSKLNQFSSEGYFSQVYESSLQATYFALYVLNATGTLGTINQAEILSYIMAHYNESSYIFMDNYAERYLHTDFSNMDYLNYFQFPSLLEVNCYAILSLYILDKLDLIDVPGALNFIWDCYNPDTSGFIGQPYSATLLPYFKISTIDDTYHAILALEVLGDDPSGHTQEWLKTIYYIKDLQDTDESSYFYGGFYNDEVDGTDTLDDLDITLMSSYYSLKSLNILNRIMTYTEFYDFLDKHYDNNVPYFEMSYVMRPTNCTDIVGTALGLQLSDLTGYSSIDRNGVINFILDNRNPWGIWDASRYYSYHELIDTFQVIRALYETGELSLLSSNDKDQIASSIINYYQQYDNGFSLLSKDYTSLRLLHTIVKSAFNIYLKSEFVDYIPEIYDQVVSSYHYSNGDHLFAGSIDMFQQSPVSSSKSLDFRSRPLEYNSDLYDENYNGIRLPYSHTTNYYALEVLYNIGMLDEFDNVCNLNDLVDNIIETQFLNYLYPNYGGFTPNPLLNSIMDDDEKNSHVFLEHNFHVVKTLELLTNFLNLGQLNDLDFNKAALYSYVMSTINESSTTICCDVSYTKSSENILMNTFYAISILKALNLFDLQKQKIKNFVLQTIDYTNIKNIYYSFKISELLDLEVEFDIDLTSSLVEALYSNEFKEYYQSTNLQVLNHDIFLWVCDIAMTDDFQIDCNYKSSVYLGEVNTITTSFSNMIFSRFDQYFDVQFQSPYFGTLLLEKQFDSTYQLSFLVPEDPAYYPGVTGILKIYHHSKLLGELPIIFQTLYDFNYNDKIVEVDDKFYFGYNVSYGFASGKSPADNTRIYATVFKNGTYYKTENFTRDDYADYSKFTFNYSNSDEYTFNISLIDDFHSDGILLNKSINQKLPSGNGGHGDDGGDSSDSGDDTDSSSSESQINWLLTVVIGLIVGLALSITCLWTYIKKIRSKNRDISLIEKFGADRQEKIPINTFQDSVELDKQLFNNSVNGISNPYINDELQNTNFQSSRTNFGSEFNQKLNDTLEFANSLMAFLVKYKKLLFLILMGILLVIGAYYYGPTLMLILVLGGIIVISLGAVGLFLFDRKKSAKALLIGFVSVGLGIIVYVLNIYMHLLKILIFIYL